MPSDLVLSQGIGAAASEPRVRRIGPRDLRAALARGLDDFLAAPTHLVFLGLIYPIIGLILGRMAFGDDLLPLVYPLVSGFALLGPVAAVGLYELSRRRERGLRVSALHALDVLRSPSIFSVVLLGLLLLAIFVVWLVVAEAIYDATLGPAVPATMDELLRAAFGTPQGWALILLGNGVGLLFAILVLTIAVVSFPMLLDRDVGPIVAVRTSVRAVRANPGTMALWGLIIAVALALGSLPFLVGLAVVMPVLGHASWHLYRAVVEPPESPLPVRP